MSPSPRRLVGLDVVDELLVLQREVMQREIQRLLVAVAATGDQERREAGRGAVARGAMDQPRLLPPPQRGRDMERLLVEQRLWLRRKLPSRNESKARALLRISSRSLA